jgi:O-antigen/teichoic acid export membrane protein
MKKKILLSIFSNWANLFSVVVLAFIVSPILIQQLGNETYGIWILIVSVTSYFTVLDFGVNTAIVRYVSKYTALKDSLKTNEIYSSSFGLFSIIAVVVIMFTLIFAYFFKDIFSITSLSQTYLYFVFLVVGIDLAANLVFSVFLGTMKGLQRFLEVNMIVIGCNIVKNIILVYLLLNEYSIFSIAVLQLLINLIIFALQYYVIRSKHPSIKASFTSINKPTIYKLYNYSIYSFAIAIATKILFYTDSVVIGSVLDVSQVAIYSIASMLAQYLEQFIWAIVVVFIPIISAKDATGEKDNSKLYVIGAKYSMLLCTPVIIVLLLNGDRFIGLWIGDDYATTSGNVLKVLLVAYLFSLSQLIAHGILKGISKHKALAYILCIEAIINLFLSLYLAKKYGIIGVALGTVIPMVIVNLFILPYYTCSVLNIGFIRYFITKQMPPILSFSLFLCFFYWLNITIDSYIALVSYSALVAVTYYLYAFFVHLETSHKIQIYQNVRKRLKYA